MPLTTSIAGIPRCPIGADQIGGLKAPYSGKGGVTPLDRHIDLRIRQLVGDRDDNFQCICHGFCIAGADPNLQE